LLKFLRAGDEYLSQSHLHVPRPHYSSPRKIQDGQYIHQSVFSLKVNGQEYAPIAQLPHGKKWSQEDLTHEIEDDPYASAKGTFDRLKAGDIQATDMNILTTLMSSGEYTLYFSSL
jgi:hypothetical protein